MPRKKFSDEQIAFALRQRLDLIGGGLTGGVAGETLHARFEDLLRPSIAERGGGR